MAQTNEPGAESTKKAGTRWAEHLLTASCSNLFGLYISFALKSISLWRSLLWNFEVHIYLRAIRYLDPIALVKKKYSDWRALWTTTYNYVFPFQRFQEDIAKWKGNFHLQAFLGGSKVFAWDCVMCNLQIDQNTNVSTVRGLLSVVWSRPGVIFQSKNSRSCASRCFLFCITPATS